MRQVGSDYVYILYIYRLSDYQIQLVSTPSCHVNVSRRSQLQVAWSGSVLPPLGIDPIVVQKHPPQPPVSAFLANLPLQEGTRWNQYPSGKDHQKVDQELVAKAPIFM